MRPIVTFAAAVLGYTLGLSPMMAEQVKLQVPQSIRLQHEQIISRLEYFANSKDKRAAAAAQKLLSFVKEHYAKEEEFVLPPLGLLPRLAKGEVSKDMEPAIAMADRTKAALGDFEKEHVKITTLITELIEVAKKRNNDELVRFATRVAGQSLNDIEVAQPTTILIGEYLRQRLSLSGSAASSAGPQTPHQTVGQAGQPSAPTRATGWTRARLEAAKKHWAEDQARFKECVGELDSLKKKSKRWMSYHRQGHFLEKCMKEKHPA